MSVSDTAVCVCVPVCTCTRVCKHGEVLFIRSWHLVFDEGSPRGPWVAHWFGTLQGSDCLHNPALGWQTYTSKPRFFVLWGGVLCLALAAVELSL